MKHLTTQTSCTENKYTTIRGWWVRCCTALRHQLRTQYNIIKLSSNSTCIGTGNDPWRGATYSTSARSSNSCSRSARWNLKASYNCPSLKQSRGLRRSRKTRCCRKLRRIRSAITIDAILRCAGGNTVRLLITSRTKFRRYASPVFKLKYSFNDTKYY